MTRIIPIAGWRYSPEKISDMSKVVAPPYDVISPTDLIEYKKRSPFNVTWIDLPQEADGLGKYEVAKEIFEEWKNNGVLIHDSQPSLYLYFQTYRLPNGQSMTRKGFFAGRSLETFEEGGVKPHEKTFEGPKADRLKLTVATGANLSSIFSVYADPENQVGPQLDRLALREPDLQIEGDNDQVHRLWKVDDPKEIEVILDPLQGHPVMIADGHHRYETALNYRGLRRAELGKSYTGEEPFNFVMMYFCSMQDPGLVVLPTHRVLNERPSVDQKIISELLGRYATSKRYSVEQYREACDFMEREGEREHLLGWVHDGMIDVLIFDPELLLKSESLNHLHYALRDLDVTILHDLVMEEIMGVPKGAQREYGTISYIKDAAETLKVTQEKKSYGFLMNPTKISQMEAITEIGETMPQKSTFFYPKLLTGLLFNDLD